MPRPDWLFCPLTLVRGEASSVSGQVTRDRIQIRAVRARNGRRGHRLHSPDAVQRTDLRRAEAGDRGSSTRDRATSSGLYHRTSATIRRFARSVRRGFERLPRPWRNRFNTRQNRTTPIASTPSRRAIWRAARRLSFSSTVARRLGIGNRRRRAAGSQECDRHRLAQLWQGIGADHPSLGRDNWRAPPDDGANYTPSGVPFRPRVSSRISKSCTTFPTA